MIVQAVLEPVPLAAAVGVEVVPAATSGLVLTEHEIVVEIEAAFAVGVPLLVLVVEETIVVLTIAAALAVALEVAEGRLGVTAGHGADEDDGAKPWERTHMERVSRRCTNGSKIRKRIWTTGSKGAGEGRKVRPTHPAHNGVRQPSKFV
jgi:hypothetical protein